MRNNKPVTTHHPRRLEQAKRNRIDDRLRRLASLCGVASSYVDEGGRRRLVREHSLSRILAVLGVRAETPEVEADELRRICLLWRLKQERGMITRGRRPGSALNIVSRAMVDGVCHQEINMPFPKNIPFGYHSLSLEASGPRGSQLPTMTVIVVPDHGYLHPHVKGSRRAWRIKAGPSKCSWKDWTTLDRVRQLAAVTRARKDPVWRRA